MIETKLARKLLKIEAGLNEILLSDHKLGQLLSKFLYEIALKNNQQRFTIIRFIALLFNQLIHGLFIKDPYVITSKNKTKILFSKLVDKPQTNALIDPLYHRFIDCAIIWTPGSKNQIIPYDFIRNNSFLFQTKLLFKILGKWSRIRRAYKHSGLKADNLKLYYTIFFQLTATYNWRSILRIIKPKIVVVDFDRDTKNAPLISAANSLNIKTITLVHGVINPPYGYWPVIADEIWCWGKFQKKQLIKHGVNKNKIRIVGNPIARSYNIGTNRKNTKNIGVGLNNVSDSFNDYFLSEILKSTYSKKFNWIIKLHPSMQLNSHLKSFESNNVKFIESKTDTRKQFLEQIELLIISTSSLGYEAIVNNIPIWVFLDSKNSSAHDKVMIDDGNCPNISEKAKIEAEMIKWLANPTYITELLAIEKKFVLEEFYFKYGNEASREAISQLKKMLNDPS